MYKQDLVLNNLQWLICHKTKPNPKKDNENAEPFFIISTNFNATSMS